MEFSPTIDPRLMRFLARERSLCSSAAAWRRLRGRARVIGSATPCYESVRKLVHHERARRAHLMAVLATVAEITARRIPVLPEQVPGIHARHFAHALRTQTHRHADTNDKGTGPP